MSALKHAVESAGLLRDLIAELKAQGGIPDLSGALAIRLAAWVDRDAEFQAAMTTTAGQGVSE